MLGCMGSKAALARVASIGAMGGLLCCASAAPPPVEAPVQEHGNAATVVKAAVGAEASAPPTAPSTPLRWIEDEAAGIAVARQEGKPTLISFEAAWCMASRELERRTFSDADVKTALRRFVTIRIDASDDDAPETAPVTKKYGVIGLPTIVILDASGHEFARVTEFVPPQHPGEHSRKGLASLGSAALCTLPLRPRGRAPRGGRRRRADRRRARPCT